MAWPWPEERCWQRPAASSASPENFPPSQHGLLSAWHEERALRRAKRCDWLLCPFWNLPEKASQSGKELTCCVRFSSVEHFLGTMLAQRHLYFQGRYLGDNLMLLMFCLHRVSRQDTAHHIPGVFGQKRETVHCVHSQARWQQADHEEVMVRYSRWEGEVLTFFFNRSVRLKPCPDSSSCYIGVPFM